jgi:hypothetical protein
VRAAALQGEVDRFLFGFAPFQGWIVTVVDAGTLKTGMEIPDSLPNATTLAA